MANNSIYNYIITAKNGDKIPVFKTGRTVDSKYDPQKESNRILETLKIQSNFIIIIGIGSGILISKLSKSFPNKKIIAIEKTKQDIIFLSQLEIIKTLLKNNNIIFTDIEHIDSVLINNYLPGKYGEFNIIEQKGWINENLDCIKIINDKINTALSIISSDFSVQSHFGKIWQKNILNNLKLLSHINTKININEQLNKTAIVVAAGPSLENYLKILKKDINHYFIIATDTSFPILIKNNIQPNIVVSIDGQFVSHNHFFESKLNSETIYLLDLCSDNATANYLFSKKSQIIFFQSGHPLSSFISSFSKSNVLSLYSGAGTVTITALDFAIKCGFKHIKIIGADFSYNKGKAYSNGTYFENLYGTKENKIYSLDKLTSLLMFRTQLSIVNTNIYTTKLLNSYKNSLELYLKNNNCNFKLNDFLYDIINNNKNKEINTLQNFNIDFNQFILNVKAIPLNSLEYSLLPYIAWMRNQKKYKYKDYEKLLKLAYTHFVSYN